MEKNLSGSKALFSTTVQSSPGIFDLKSCKINFPGLLYGVPVRYFIPKMAKDVALPIECLAEMITSNPSMSRELSGHGRLQSLTLGLNPSEVDAKAAMGGRVGGRVEPSYEIRIIGDGKNREGDSILTLEGQVGIPKSVVDGRLAGRR